MKAVKTMKDMKEIFTVFIIFTIFSPCWLFAQVLPPPRDGDVRTERDGFSGDTRTYLTLVLRNAKGQIPINMAVTTIRKARAKASEPPAVQLDFNTSLFAGGFDPKPPHLTVTLDRKLPSEKSLRGKLDPNVVVAPGGGIGGITVPLSIKELKAMAAATTVDGQVLGLEFILTAGQLKALKSFAARR